MLSLPQEWIDRVLLQPESGMGYHIVTVTLTGGRRFEQCVFNSGYISRGRGHRSVPFSAEEIAAIAVTHDRWDFNRES